MTTTAESRPKHTNHLIHATSPYLLQHAHNPVEWYEWGPEALERARREDRPIFLSIGYSACHWCHVMERESFENEAIASIMNEHFINIKVDREERPDLDDTYMTATQVFTRSGGWPMSVWLTPDLKPFYAGTYFPPEQRYGRPGFKDVLLFLADAWKNRRDEITKQANSLTDAVIQISAVEPGQEIVPYETIERSANFLARAFDPVKGGISGGGTNKFPPSMSMNVMLRVWDAKSKNARGEGASTQPGDSGAPAAKLLQLVELTLEKMARGGIYDHLGGGIARYSTDVDWLVPHFEKMLYDQALVSDSYLKGYQATGKSLYAETARGIFDYVIRDLQSPEGGFYSSRDADSEGEEGKFYVWSKRRIVEVLGERDAALFCDYFDVTDQGNWEGHNILNIPRSVETVAQRHGLAPDAFRARIDEAKRRLFDERERRVKPHLDDKVLSAWNGLMIASLARGSQILGEPKYLEAARRAADFVLSKMTADGRLLRTYRQGKAHTLGYLDDHAFMIEACLNLFEASGEAKWLDRAIDLNDDLMKHYRDDVAGGFFYTADDAEKTLVRKKDADDGAIPSGNSVQLMNLLRLAVLLDQEALAAEAERMIRTFANHLSGRTYLRSERMLCALDFYHRRPKEVAIVSPSADPTAAAALIQTVWRTYVPNMVFIAAVEGAPDADALSKRLPLLAGKRPLDQKPTAYVCRNYACEAPTTDAEVLRQQIMD